MAMNQLSQTVNRHITLSKTVSTSLRSEIATSMAEVQRKIDSFHEETKIVAKRIDYVAELLEKKRQDKRKIALKMIELRKKKMEDKPREKEEKK